MVTWFIKMGELGIWPPPGNAEQAIPSGGSTVTEVSPGAMLGKTTTPLPPSGTVLPNVGAPAVMIQLSP